MSLVFRKGKWIEVALPKPVDPLWSLQDQKMYASLAISLGETHAEAFVHKKLHPGLVYSKEMEAYWSRGNNITPQSTKKNMSV